MGRGGGLSPAGLAAVALGAAALNQLFWLLPLALMLGLPAVWFGNAFLAGLALLAFVVLAWVLQPSRPAPPDELAPHEAPALYARVHALADALQAPRVHAIALDDELNAGALELNRGVSLRPVRRVLVLGRPLLAALDTAAAEAVIAHELGHFSRQHGRLGHWLYGTRASWQALAHLDDGDAGPDSSAWERAAGHFAARFLPWFNRLSFGHMRRCEFEADAAAASACGAAELARALTLVERLHLGRMQAGPLRRRLLRAHAEPPADLLAREVAGWREAAQGMAAWVDEDGHDGTHPPLAQRLAALGVPAQEPAWPQDCAGAQWLGECWPPAFGGRQAASARLHWAIEHRLLQGLAPQPDLPPARRLQMALVLGDPAPVAMDASGATPAELLLLARFELLAGRRDAARALLEACREHKTAERDLATAWLVQHGLGEDAMQRRRHAAWLAKVSLRRDAALDELAADRDHGKIGDAPLSSDEAQALADAWRAHPAVAEAWMFGQSATVQQVAYQAVVLLLRVDPERLAALGLQDDDVAELAHQLLACVSAPGHLRLVLTRYTTEGLAPVLAQALTARPASRLC